MVVVTALDAVAGALDLKDEVARGGLLGGGDMLEILAVGGKVDILGGGSRQNIVGGLDRYTDGDLIINGKSTKQFKDRDWDAYRNHSIGFVFQSYNLIPHQSVLQNVELALLLNGEKKDAVKEKVNEIIDKVGLTEFSKTKCSKLSGGQKQRVAIARALAKETPIIVADEPTGNLDTESAAEVIRLLSQVAKDKLVIIVTHNIEQVENHATRLIKMHDGKILEDKVVTQVPPKEEEVSREYRDITFGNRIRLGLRNAFNIPMKFTLIFAVFLLIAFSIATAHEL